MPTTAALLEVLATEKAKEVARQTHDPLYWSPTVQLLAEDAGQCWFLFDFMVLHPTQSGSETYDHYVFTGTATVREGAIADSFLTLQRQQYVTEWMLDWAPDDQRYQREFLPAQVKAAWVKP